MKFLKRLLISLLVIAVLFFGLSFAAVSYGTAIRPVKYRDLIVKYSEENHLDPLLVTALIDTESSFRPDVESPQGAKGLMQLLPDTAEWVSKEIERPFESDKLFDPDYNISLGTYYLRWLLDHFKEQDLALAAYNGGIGNVEKWLSDKKYSEDGKTLDSIPLKETEGYVKKVNRSYEIFDLFYREGLPSDEREESTLRFYMRNYVNLFKNLISDF